MPRSVSDFTPPPAVDHLAENVLQLILKRLERRVAVQRARCLRRRIVAGQGLNAAQYPIHRGDEFVDCGLRRGGVGADRQGRRRCPGRRRCCKLRVTPLMALATTLLPLVAAKPLIA